MDEAFDLYVGHQTVTGAVSGYVSDVQLAEQNNKPYVMLETNTASCAGFYGTSDAFIAAIWAIDYDLQMASINASAAMFHLGGQNALYNVSFYDCLDNFFLDDKFYKTSALHATTWSSSEERYGMDHRTDILLRSFRG